MGEFRDRARRRHGESALQEATRPSSCGLATMESGHGTLYRTGRVVERYSDLCRRSEWKDRVRRCGGLRSRGNRVVREVEGALRCSYWARDRSNEHMAV